MITPIRVLNIREVCGRMNDFLFSADDIKKLAKKEREKAIEEFAEACKNHIFCQTFGLHPKTIDEIAKELKGE